MLQEPDGQLHGIAAPLASVCISAHRGRSRAAEQLADEP